MDENSSNERNYRKRRGIFFPLLLLTSGVLLLLSNFGYLPGGFWGFVELYWPVLLMAAGLDGLIRGNGITASVLIIGFGGVLLAGNLGYIEISAWELLTKAWPLILIGMGLDIIVGHRTVARSLIGLFIAFLLIAGLVWVADFSLPGSVKTQEFNQNYRQESSLILNLDRTAGSIKVKSGSKSDSLVKARLNLLKNETVEPVIQQNADSTEIDLEDNKTLFPGTSRPVQNLAWEIAVNPKPLLILKSKIAMGENNLDLRDLNVKELVCETAAGRSVIYVSETRDSRYRISGATGQISIHVPAGAPVKITAEKAIGALTVPSKYVRENGFYKSPAYKSGAPAIEISVELPIGAIQVVEYSTTL
ncbi:LiaF transmembrane domain-containing protein [Leptolinea tardivitalis]|uniref:DUF5668 domain-containing protein n=1 Tax=Leptolinea tardivitalis TaxID=229920 RepID=A0A0N8GLN1_9CHLR|nr:DUF5668 domain-containing protein [Leptolinea tardivitalis]KPL72962.1 hypothetical protein ADM99_07990 [Leptolinea tardivitalis]GAP20638.1 hypothetical protein LTAR_00832 [Leptolinea tardivitalis]